MKSTRFAILCAAIVPALFFSSSLFSQIVTTNASDNAGNYAGNWGDGSNGGTGFQAWTFNSGAGTGGAGRFIGNPANVGITGMSESSFALYANPVGSGAFIDAIRVFSSPLAVGDTLEFKWAINWDSAGGNKGFSLSAGSTEVINVNNGSSQDITLNGNNVNFGYGTNAMTWSFTRTATNSVRVVANDRDGNGTYSNNLTVANGAIDRIKFYAAGLSNDNGGNREPYFNDFLITSTTADVTPPVINLAAGVDKVTWVAKDGTVNLSNADVTATDGSGTANVTFSPATVNTASNGITTVTYTATDSSSNTATVTRLITVGNAAPGYHNLRFPASMTLNTSSSDSAYGEIYLDGATPGAGAASGIQAWIGVNTNDSAPSSWDDSVWSAASYIGEEGNNDNYQGTISGTNRAPGTYFYANRFRLGTNAANTNFFYGGIGSDGVGGTWGGTRQVVVSGVTNTITNGNGVLSVEQGRLVTYAVDMSVQRFKGLFNPSNHSLQVRTGMNTPSYAERALTNTTGDLYTGTFVIPGANASTNLFKFYAVGTNGLAWEDGAERQLVLVATNQNAGTNFFNNLLESRKISFAVDMSEQVTKGNLNPAIDSVSLFIFTAGLDGNWTMNRVTNSSEFTYDWFFDGSMATFPTNFAYKFFNNRTGAPNSGYEGGFNRTLAASDVSPGNLSTTTLGLVTFVDATPTGATFAGWAGGGALTNSANVGKYAIGGATNLSAASETPVSLVDSNTLSLSAVVRTNDAKLKVEGEAGGSLTNWSTNGVSMSPSADTNGVPEGHQRQVFSVDRTNSPTKQFLRLKATLE